METGLVIVRHGYLVYCREGERHRDMIARNNNNYCRGEKIEHTDYMSHSGIGCRKHVQCLSCKFMEMEASNVVLLVLSTTILTSDF